MKMAKCLSAFRALTLTASAVVLTLAPSAARADQPIAVPVAGAAANPLSVFANAKPKPLPTLNRSRLSPLGQPDAKAIAGAPLRAVNQKAKVLSPGNPGGPVQKSVQMLPSAADASRSRGLTSGSTGGTAGAASQLAIDPTKVVPMDVGDGNWPFTTARVQVDGKGITSSAYPYRAAGKLALNYRGLNTWCSASLIKRGILVTAAHCVADFGSGGLLPAANWAFIPGFYNGKAAYGVHSAQAVIVSPSYLDGTAPCATPGVICENDIALIVLKPDRRGRYVGTRTGWLGYGYGDWGFTTNGETQVTQLGYPGGIDFGGQMIRTDSQGIATDGTLSYNTIIATLMDGGSSGGPWVNNFGIQPVFNNVIPGYYPAPNVVVGVTSWGVPDNGLTALAGASPFTAANIESMVNTACAAYPGAC